MKVAEAEFAFVLGKAMPERGTPYTQAEVMDAVTALHLSIEVPDSRYADFTKVGAPSLIADMACPAWLALGPAVEADWRGIDLAEHRGAWPTRTASKRRRAAARRRWVTRALRSPGWSTRRRNMAAASRRGSS